jgi:hypothetical protein
MSAERLIALEHAMADLSRRYTAARIFRSLAVRAEGEWLPRIAELGRELRKLARQGGIAEADLKPVATTILALATDWEAALQAVRSSSLYEEARTAVASGDVPATQQLLPQLFTDMEPVRASTALYLPFEPSSGRRKPGHSPFLSPAECAQRLQALRTAGVGAEVHGDDWWEQDFPYIACALTPADLEQPIWLRADTVDLPLALFAAHRGTTHRLYTRRLEAPLSVGLEPEAGDEWWLAYERSYADFRSRLIAELQSCDMPIARS